MRTSQRGCKPGCCSEDRERPRKGTGHGTSVGGSLRSRGTPIRGLSWAAARGEDPHTRQPPPRGLYQGHTWAHSRDSPDSLNATSLSHGHILGAASGSGDGRGNPHSKDRAAVGSLCLGPGHGLSLTFPGTHPSCRLLQPPVNLCSACVLRGQEGVSRARRWPCGSCPAVLEAEATATTQVQTRQSTD